MKQSGVVVLDIEMETADMMKEKVETVKKTERDVEVLDMGDEIEMEKRRDMSEGKSKKAAEYKETQVLEMKKKRI